MARRPGLEIDRAASTNLVLAHFALAPGARLRIGPGVVTERRRDGVRFLLGEGAQVEIGSGTWLRSELGPVVLSVGAGARLTIGPDCFLNGCHLSAKQALTLGRRVFVGPGARVFDADQHDLDDATPERSAPVEIGDHTWIAADVTVLRGVKIGEHCAVGTRSLVTHDVPPHSLAFGQPARARRSLGDRSGAR